MDILKDKWSPALQVRTVLLSIQALLSAPNPDGTNLLFTFLHIRILFIFILFLLIHHFFSASFPFIYLILFFSLLTRATDPLANDVAEHWKSNEKAAINTGILLFLFCIILHHILFIYLFIFIFGPRG